MPEEMAWRGYALDVFQSRWNALEASLILGILWAIWNLPFILINSSHHLIFGLGTPLFWLYMLVKVPQSVLLTWIYNNSQRSITSAILFHFMINLMGVLFILPYRAEMTYIASWWILAVIVIGVWKPQNFLRAGKSI